eukprot:756999-Hanusia_phi.AAC.2
MGIIFSVPVAEPLDITAIHKAESEAKKSKSFVLRNAKLPACPRRLPYLSKLREVDLSSNRIVEMPFEIGRLYKLQSLNLSQNFLSKLPSSLGDCVALKEIVISNNVIDAIPDQLGQLKLLEQLDASHNRLFEIPPSLKNCVSLVYLNVGENLIEVRMSFRRMQDMVHNALKQQGGYAIFNERKIRRIKARGWPPNPDPGKLKGWGED